MAFSFTLDDMASIIINRGGAGVRVRGIFERTGSETQFSELRPLRCAGLDARQDGNPFVLHHKVFIVDGQFVLTGSFNFSASATRSNDENLLIINDPDLARLYAQEFERRWAESRVPTLTC
jgi:phosphatidylserine/phosphatidylglycerophosphate/cardiolipin synthase-like enzyme